MKNPRTDDAPPPSWRRLHEAAYLLPRALYGFGHLGPRGPEDGPPALVIPGFIANDRTTMELRRALAADGWRVHPWDMGWNMGVRADTVDRLRERLDAISPDEPLLVVGWSLGGVSALAGASFELTRLIFGTVQAGYLSRRYDDPLLRDFNGVSFAANVLWNPTSLTSVTLRAGRSVEESASTTFAGNTRSDFSVRVDHELFRYVLISGDLGYDRFRANGPGPRGNEYTAGLAARYLIDRRFTLTGSVRTSRRSSDIAGLRYNATSGAIGLRAAF